MLSRFINTVQELSKGLVQGQSIEAWLELLCERISVTIVSDRASVWKYHPETGTITCSKLFDRSTGIFSSGLFLEERLFPNYFEELKAEKIIDANNAFEDHRTSEFLESYLRPLGIKAMLDTPIFYNGKLEGVICIESKEIRNWSLEEKMLARSMADLCTIAFVQNQLQQAFATIEAQKRNIEEINSSLEKRVTERTKELERQNELLIEYSFINSHLLRGPICTLKGLHSLLQMDELKFEHPEYIKKMVLPINQLNDLSDKMNASLTRGISLSREDLRKKEEGNA